MKTITPRRAYTVAELAAITGVSQQNIHNQYRRGELTQYQPQRLGNRLVFPKAVVDKLFPEVAA